MHTTHTEYASIQWVITLGESIADVVVLRV
jgi:hypothetical protein